MVDAIQAECLCERESVVGTSSQVLNLNNGDRLSSEQNIVRCVQLALRIASPDWLQQERRRERRHPFPYPVRLQPVNAEGDHVADSVVVVGKHIANHGLDFYYLQPIPHRRVVARFESVGCATVEILMDLTWCRFGKHGWYENGGRFLSALKLPASATVGNDELVLDE